MTVTKALVFAIVVAALLPAGRDMLDDLVRDASNARWQAVSSTSIASVAPAMAGSIRSGMAGDAAGFRDIVTGQ